MAEATTEQPTNPAGSAPQPLGPDFFRARLAAERGEADPAPAGEEVPEDHEEQPLAADSDDDLTGALDQDDEAESEDSAEAEQPEGEAEESVTQAIEVDGETFTAQQIREMKLGQLRQADYTRKSQELAEQRRALETAVTDVEQFGSFYEQLAESMTKPFQSVDWEMLRAQDTEKHNQALLAFQVRKREAEAITAKAQEFAQKAQELKLQAHQAQVQQAVEMAPKLIPGWSPEVYAELQAHAVNELGYTPDEAANVTDIRVVRGWYDSAQIAKAGKSVADLKPGERKEKPQPKGRPAPQRERTRPDGKMRAAYARWQKDPNSANHRAFLAEKLAYERQGKT
jgi:hypothetical protein